MALGAVLAAALTDHAARVKALYIDNLDVLLAPGTEGNRMGVPIDSVRMTEAGPGGVSDIEFVLEDPQLQATVVEGSVIRFHDILRDTPLFTGYVQSVTRRPAFGEQGRIFEVKGVGVEVLLDWAVTNVALTFTTPFVGSPSQREAIVTIAQNATGFYGVRAVYGPDFTGSTQAFPISATLGAEGFEAEAVTIPAGTSVREAIRLYATSRVTGSPPAMLVTIDFYLGLRVWDDLPNDVAESDPPTDYTNLVINDSPGGAIVAEDLQHETDAAGVVRGVWVFGTGFSALTLDGTGLPGPISTVTDTELTTQDAVQAAATAYMQQFATGVRGTFKMLDHTPVPTIHPGSRVRIGDDRIPLAYQPYRIAQIEKAFHPTRDDWIVAYGGNRPSAVAAIRRLTRYTRN